MLIKEKRNIEEDVVVKVICSCCGNQLNVHENDYIHIEKKWGYFSNKDGVSQSLDLCEKCWDKIYESSFNY